jgi:hypothetical protein
MPKRPTVSKTYEKSGRQTVSARLIKPSFDMLNDVPRLLGIS